ncbi:MAG: hypothetical protein JXM71_06285 [Spirochaetales bacterium]|nr:hypothetical protein [Spirochaetales bacterium]
MAANASVGGGSVASRVVPGVARVATSVPAPALTVASARAAEACATLRLPADADSLLVLSAMLGENLRLDASAAVTLRRVLRLRDGNPAAARIAARALAAGLDPEGTEASSLLDAVLGVCEGGGERRGQSGEQERREPDPPPRRRGADEAHKTSDQHESHDPGEPGAVDDIARALRSEAQAAKNRYELPTFATAGIEGGWLCFPFEIRIADVDFNGFMRVLYHSGNNKAQKLVADVRFGDQRRLIELHPAGMRYHTDDPAERERFMATFGASMMVSVDDLASGDVSELLAEPMVDSDA